MNAVKVFVTTYCPFCDAAKRYLEKKGVPFETIDVTDDAERRQWLVETTGRRTVPQLFVGPHAIGGYTDLCALDKEGKLLPMLSEQEIPFRA